MFEYNFSLRGRNHLVDVSLNVAFQGDLREIVQVAVFATSIGSIITNWLVTVHPSLPELLNRLLSQVPF